MSNPSDANGLDLEALDALEKKATEAPWLLVWMKHDCAAVNAPHADIFIERDEDTVNIACATFSKADAALAVALRNSFGALRAKLAAAEKLAEACDVAVRDPLISVRDPLGGQAFFVPRLPVRAVREALAIYRAAGGHK